MDVPSVSGRLALIADAEEWSARAIQSVLEPAGYRVVRVATGSATIEQARSAQPDAILIVADLPDLDGVELCGRLRRDPLITPSTPIALMGSAPLSRERHLAGLRVGAWDVLGFPLDAEQLVLKLNAWVRAKLDADRAREAGLLDPRTGLYSARGLERRAPELVAEALRRHAALACVALGVDPRPEARGAEASPPLAVVLEHMAHALRSHGRASDAIGRWGGAEFAVLAPGTNAAGAVKLADRLSRAIEVSPPSGARLPPLEVRAGYEAVLGVHATPVEPTDLLAHASTALRVARAEPGGARIRSYSASFA